MTADEAERERREITALAIEHDADREFPPLDQAAVQAIRQRMPGLREPRQQNAA